MDNVVQLTSIIPSKLIFAEEEPIPNQDSKLSIRIWYNFERSKGNITPETVFIKLTDQVIHKVTENCVMLNITNEKLVEKFNELDDACISHLKKISFVRRHGIKKPSFMSVIEENMLSLNRQDMICYTTAPQRLTPAECKVMLVPGTEVSVIIELVEVEINLKQTTGIRLVPRQLVVTKSKQTLPKQITLNDFAFEEYTTSTKSFDMIGVLGRDSTMSHEEDQSDSDNSEKVVAEINNFLSGKGRK
jgi:hypothetical protein